MSSITHIVLNSRSSESGNYYPNIMPVADIGEALSINDYKEKIDGVSGAIVFPSTKNSDLTGPLAAIMQSKHKAFIVQETPEQIYNLIADANLGIRQTVFPKAVIVNKPNKDNDPIVIDGGGEPETNEKPV